MRTVTTRSARPVDSALLANFAVEATLPLRERQLADYCRTRKLGALEIKTRGVDVDPNNYCMDPEAAEAAITERTRAIIPVHLGAHMTDMDAIMALARELGGESWVVKAQVHAGGRGKAGGIKVALITTATGLAIAIPINIAHNYFVDRVDRIVIDMEESAQKMIDAVHAVERGTG